MIQPNQVLFVMVDSDEDTYLYVADSAAVDAYYDGMPEILGALAY